MKRESGIAGLDYLEGEQRMKLFQEITEVYKYQKASEFIKEFQIGEGDFVFTSQSVFETYFQELRSSGAVVHFKSEYGQGEPTDLMVDALLKDFRRTDCKRVIAIGGGAVIDMAKILMLDGEAKAAEYYQRRCRSERYGPWLLCRRPVEPVRRCRMYLSRR